MFVLKECSVCREDFNDERLPHNIPCGHVFCSPCLQLMASSSRSCPDCQVSYSPNSIRKVVCAPQDPASNPTNESGETLLWQVVSSAVECTDDPGQRKFLASICSEGGNMTGLSANALVAFNMLNMLIKAEESNQALGEKVETSQAIEQSLRDRISSLEVQLTQDTSQPSLRDFRLLMADVQRLHSSIETISKNTSDIAQSLKSTPAPPPPPSAIQTPTEPPQTGVPAPASPRPVSPPITPEVDRVAPREEPDSGSEDTTGDGFNFTNNRGRPSGGLTARPPFRLPDYAVRVTAPRPVETSSSTSTQPDPFSSLRQPSRDSAAVPAVPAGPSSTSSSISLPPPPPASEIPRPRKLTVIYDFTSDSPVQHNLVQGEMLQFTPQTDPEKDWIWCKNAAGKAAYAPKSYVRVDNM